MRLEFGAKTKAQGFARSGGNCEICGVKLQAAKFRYDHKLPCALGGDNSLDNLVVQCLACDTPKTADDVRRIRKADRQKRIHIGARAPSRNPIMGSKASGWKRKMNGELVRR
jgi:5-methylcytosine-specific restriction endonuclease McrA